MFPCRALSPLIAALAVTGCAEVGPGPDKDTDACGATALAGSIGQPAASLDLAPERPVRVLAPDSVITMDYRADRLNVLTDDAGIVTEFRCG